MSNQGFQLPEDVPKEPFAYMGQGRSIRSPHGQIVFASVILLGAVALVIVTLTVVSPRGDTAGLGTAIFLGLLFGGLGVVAMVIGVKRLRWYNEYHRITGTKPWA